MSKFTQWFPMSANPVRPGKYEGREKRTGLRMPVHWRKLGDTPQADWYFHKGSLGPFTLWEAAGEKMSGWRGLAEKPKDQP
jgi:hypothetical protein